MLTMSLKLKIDIATTTRFTKKSTHRSICETTVSVNLKRNEMTEIECIVFTSTLSTQSITSVRIRLFDSSK